MLAAFAGVVGCSDAADRPPMATTLVALPAGGLGAFPPRVTGGGAPPSSEVAGFEEDAAPGLIDSPGPGWGTEIPLRGRLEGEMGGYHFEHDATSRRGSAENWQYGGLLSLRLEVSAPSVGGMMQLDFVGGPGHPLFEDGRLSSDDASAGQVDEAAVDTWTRLCAGPSREFYDWEEEATAYEMRIEPDPSDPGVLVLEADLSIGGELMTGSFAFRPPE